MRQRFIGSDVGYDVAQRHHRLFDLPERQRIVAAAGGGGRDLVDLVRQDVNRVLEADQALGRGQAAQGIAHFGEPAFQRAERAAVGAGLSGAIEPLGECAHLTFERLDGVARHRLGQRPSDLGEVVAQCVERILVGLVQGGNLRVDLAELLLDPDEVRCAVRRRRRGRLWHWRYGRSAAIEDALPRDNLRRPVGRAGAWRGRRL